MSDCRRTGDRERRYEYEPRDARIARRLENVCSAVAIRGHELGGTTRNDFPRDVEHHFGAGASLS